MNIRQIRLVPLLALHFVVTAMAPQPVTALGGGSGEVEIDGSRQWLSGDHHIHSRFSVGWDRTVDPPKPRIAGDAIYPTPMNALMAKYYGLGWMVTTDHGGPFHSKVNRDLAYPELLRSRDVVPEVVQFYGMEFDTPGADHSSLIIPHTHDEVDRLFEIESRFNRQEPHPNDGSWDTEPRMLEALKAMNRFETRPVIIANHPSRSASGLGVYGRDDPAEFRDWNDTAPEIAVGMAGAPGHQAKALNRDGTLKKAPRGSYRNHPTMGGFDQMTARVGGFWDSMLGEGRHWWITSNSDSHINWREGGSDFWPGEYSKTYVWAQRNHDDILDGIRHGRVFVTLGDLISQLQITARGGRDRAQIGGALSMP
ncbi:MAG: phosphoesterase, partial [Gemmatimonadetes bacterium]|nr:phosphoesterase [Gemmatimonadota bacterium]